MATLIIPCAGRSSRFPGMRPKYLLNHPDGMLMVEKAMAGLPLGHFDRIIITIVKEHSEKFDAKLILEQAFGHNKKIEVVELPDFTSCQAETIHQTLVKGKVKGAFVVKDSDNHVKVEGWPNPEFVIGLNIHNSDQEIHRLKSKSFLVVNEQGIIVDVIEKRIQSEVICLGVYGFDSPEKFSNAYLFLSGQQKNPREIYLSHVISYLIGTGAAAYSYVETQEFEDWGTLQDWRDTQNRHAQYFIDIDGIMLENRGKYGKENWGNSLPVIEDNMKTVKKLFDNGAQIIFTTARAESDLGEFKKVLKEHGIAAHAFITNCNHAPRILINDFAPSNPYPSAKAVNVPRNGDLSTYLE